MRPVDIYNNYTHVFGAYSWAFFLVSAKAPVFISTACKDLSLEADSRSEMIGQVEDK